MGEFVAQTDAANRSLVEMENKAFELVRRKDQNAASAILSSAEYEGHKQIYADRMRKLTATADAHIRATMAAQQTRANSVFAALLCVLVVLSRFGLALVSANRRQADGAENCQPARIRSLLPVVALALLTTLLAMTAYEVLKQLFLPTITTWASHTITIGVTGVLAAGAVYWAERRHDAMFRALRDSEKRLNAKLFRTLFMGLIKIEVQSILQDCGSGYL